MTQHVAIDVLHLSVQLSTEAGSLLSGHSQLHDADLGEHHNAMLVHNSIS